MTTPSRLRVGMGDSYGIRITVPAGPDFLPAAVTGATMKVTKPNVAGGSIALDWPASIAAQSSASVQAVYSFNANGLDLDCAGAWRVWVQWTVPGQTPGPRSEVTSFTVAGADKA